MAGMSGAADFDQVPIIDSRLLEKVATTRGGERVWQDWKF